MATHSHNNNVGMLFIFLHIYFSYGLTFTISKSLEVGNSDSISGI